MAKIRIVNDEITLDIPDGEMLYRYAKDNCGIMFGCLKGECGICMCTILSGEGNLNKRTHKEHMILENRGATSAQRLACQVVVNQGEVEIEY